MINCQGGERSNGGGGDGSCGQLSREACYSMIEAVVLIQAPKPQLSPRH